MTKTNQSLVHVLSRAFCAATMLLAAASASADVIGSATIDRAQSDNFSNFVITLPSISFTTAGTINAWNVYVNNSGALGLLILRDSAGSPTVVQSVYQNSLVSGLNHFDLGSPLGVSAGDYLGIWMGSSKVDFDNSSAASGYTGDGSYASMPVVGTMLTTSGGIFRDYSINVDFTADGVVPEPASIALLCLGLGALGMARRRAQYRHKQ